MVDTTTAVPVAADLLRRLADAKDAIIGERISPRETEALASLAGHKAHFAKLSQRAGKVQALASEMQSKLNTLGDMPDDGAPSVLQWVGKRELYLDGRTACDDELKRLQPELDRAKRGFAEAKAIYESTMDALAMAEITPLQNRLYEAAGNPGVGITEKNSQAEELTPKIRANRNRYAERIGKTPADRLQDKR